MVSLPEPRVRRLAAGAASEETPWDPGARSGASLAKRSLALPAPGRIALPVRLAPGRYLFEAFAAAAPLGQGRSIRIRIRWERAGGGVSLAEVEVSGKRRGVWLPLRAVFEVPEEAAGRLVVEARGGPAVALLGVPRLWRHGVCLPGDDIVLVIVDTMRADAYDLLSGRRGVTPNLDALGREGVVFSRAFSLSTWTRPSMTGILAATWPNRVAASRVGFRLHDRERARSHALLRHRLATLHLRRLGYATAAVGNNFFFLEQTPLGLDRGIEEVMDIRGRQGLDGRAIVSVVQRLVQRLSGRPFFLWVHLDGAHWPYTPPPGYRVRGARAPGAPADRAFEAYLGEVRQADEQVGRILEGLRKAGVWERAVVAVTSDHGETFAAAHCFRMAHIETCHAHGWSIYEELLHVPLVLAGGRVPRGRRLDWPVSHLHLMPTLLEAAGLPALPGADGRSLWRAVSGRRADPPPWLWPIVAEGRRMESIRRGRYKLIRRWGFVQRLSRQGRTFRWPWELYDLARDPLETRNLADRLPEVRRRLAAELGRVLSADEAPKPAAAQQWVLHLALRGKLGPASVRIQTGSRPLVLAVGQGDRVEWLESGGLLVRLSGGPASHVALAVSGSVRLRVRLRGRAARRGQVFGGPYGLPLPAPQVDLDESDFRRHESPRSPVSSGLGGRAGLFVWTSRTWVDGGRGGRRASRAAARDVDGLLRAWGYASDPTRR